jgi:hypothetical protein
LINCKHEACMMVNRGIVSLGSFLSSEEAGRSRVTLRESRDVRRDVLVPGLSPLGSLVMITLVGCMWSV